VLVVVPFSIVKIEQSQPAGGELDSDDRNPQAVKYLPMNEPISLVRS
jgi:hypothetical protein